MVRDGSAVHWGVALLRGSRRASYAAAGRREQRAAVSARLNVCAGVAQRQCTASERGEQTGQGGSDGGSGCSPTVSAGAGAATGSGMAEEWCSAIFHTPSILR